MRNKNIPDYILFDLDGWRRETPEGSFREDVLGYHNTFYDEVMHVALRTARKSLEYYERKKQDLLRTYPYLEHLSSTDSNRAEEQDFQLCDMFIPMLKLRLASVEEKQQVSHPHPAERTSTVESATSLSRPTPSKAEFFSGLDFRTVNFQGKRYTLTRNQSYIVQELWDAYERGTPEVGKDLLLQKVGTSNLRLRDQFRTTKELWGRLIVEGKKRGTYRLNLSDSRSSHS